MRSLIGFLAFTATLVGLLAAFAVPAFVEPAVVAAVRAASPFGEQPLEVEVDVDAIGLLRGFVGEIRISGSNLATDGATIGALDITVRGVGIADRAFDSIVGSLGAIDVVDGDGSTIRVESVALSGPSGAVEAVAHVDAAQSQRLLLAALADAGYVLDGLRLVDGGVEAVILGQSVLVAPVVLDGGLYVPSIVGGGSIPVVVPAAGDAWRITAAAVSRSGLTIEAIVDSGRILDQSAVSRRASASSTSPATTSIGAATASTRIVADWVSIGL